VVVDSVGFQLFTRIGLELTAYEKRRLENIKRNEELLAQLGIDKVKADIAVEDDDANSR
jgi:hypothetical protein